MKTYKVKNYKGNLVESLSNFEKMYKELKIIEAIENGDVLKIKAKEKISEKIENLSTKTFYHGSPLHSKKFKISPPSPEKPIYVSTDKRYAEWYAEQALDYNGKEGAVYTIKLAKNVNLFDPRNSADTKKISKYLPRLIRMAWFGENIYKSNVKHYEELDLYDISRTLIPSSDRQESDIVKVPKGNKNLQNEFEQDLKELDAWCKDHGYSSKKNDNENFIRTEILKILDKLGYQAYYGTELEAMNANEIEGNIYGIFNIKAIADVSANKINDPIKDKGHIIEDALKIFGNALVKCITKNISQLRNDLNARKKFINSISDAILKTKFFYDGYGKDSVEYLNQQFSTLLKRYSPEQLQLCLKLLKNRYSSDLYTFVWDKKEDKSNKLIKPLFNAIDKDGVDINSLNVLKIQFNELLKK